MRAFAFHRVASVAEAITEHTVAGRMFLAGGTTLIDLVKLDVMRPAGVVDINRLPLTQVERLADGRLRIGALVRNSDLAWHPEVQRDYPLVSAAILAGASAQLRNMATTAGNLMQRTRCPYFRDNVSPCNKRAPGSGCAALDGYNRIHAVLGGSEHCIAAHPSDLCVAFAALEATVEVAGPSGNRTIPFSEFHLQPGATPDREHALGDNEIITGVLLPRPLPGARMAYVKLRDRQSFEFALASAGVIIVSEGSRLRDVRIALGGVATKPWRATSAETILRDATASDEVFARAAVAALEGAAPRKYNAFKIPLARQAIVRALREATAAAG